MKISKHIVTTGGSLAGFFIVVAIVIAVNVILGSFNVRKDLTEEKLYELSEGTHRILQKLKDPVTLKFFFNGSSTKIPMHIKQFTRRVEDLLLEYKLAATGNITVEKYDPKPDSDAEEWAQRYGVMGRALGLMGPTLYIGLVAAMGDTEAVLPVLDPRTENLLEYDITRMITRVASPEKSVVGVISSLPVLGTDRPPFPLPNQPAPQPSWFAFRDLNQDYDVRKINTPADSIDVDVDALIVVHPKGFADDTLYAIDQFVLRGGRLLAFLDPLSMVEAETQTSPQSQFAPKSSNLKKLLDAWGVDFDTKTVVADLEAITMLRGADNRVEESTVWLTLRKGNFNAEDILTSHIESMMMPFAGSFTSDDLKDVTKTVLIMSSETSDRVDAMTAQFGGDAVRRGFTSGLMRLDLAIRLHGTFKTAFPDGKPESDEEETEEEKENEENRDQEDKPKGLIESVEKSTVVLVGDVDMIYDRFCVQEINIFGYKAHQPMNDNLTFFANAVEQIAGSTDLVSIRTRGKIERPFDVVLDLQRKAQERYLQEETMLQQQLEEAQRRLNELQAKKDKNQRFILSPRQKREIEKFQKMENDTRKKLKLVRRKLREDIERLGVKVKVINILLMPALVSVAGVSFGFYRRRKMRR